MDREQLVITSVIKCLINLSSPRLWSTALDFYLLYFRCIPYFLVLPKPRPYKLSWITSSSSLVKKALFILIISILYTSRSLDSLFICLWYCLVLLHLWLSLRCHTICLRIYIKSFLVRIMLWFVVQLLNFLNASFIWSLSLCWMYLDILRLYRIFEVTNILIIIDKRLFDGF